MTTEQWPKTLLNGTVVYACCVSSIGPTCQHQTPPPPPTCEWFALCNNPADGFLEHPILGVVPTCYRCANKLDLRLQFGTGPLCEEDPEREEWCAYHRTDHYAPTTESGAGHDGQ